MNTMTASSNELRIPTTAIRELTTSELDDVNGGFFPAIAFAVALGSHIGVGSVTTGIVGHLLSGFGLGMATFGMMSYWGPGPISGRSGGGGAGGGPKVHLPYGGRFK